MRYLFNNQEIAQDELENYRPLEYSSDLQTIILRKITNEEKIAELKKKLFETDYKALKFIEGELTGEEYEPIKQQRKAWREEIRRLGG